MKKTQITLAAMAALATSLAFGTAATAGENTDMKTWARSAGHTISKEMRYPTAAYRQNREGASVFHITVNRDGDITKSTLTQKNKNRTLNSAAKRALKRVDFPDLPSGYDGEELTFSLRMNYAIANSVDEARKLQRVGTVTSKQVAENSSATGATLKILDQAD
ncbi:MAG: energy transducer TonB [Kordiimonadaceae bacterium]|nr:energy transducer TonB [Kordiimonadaceae bacterium]